MAIAAILSIGVTVFLTVLSIAFKVAGRLRLGIPLLYLLVAVVSTFFTDWTSENEPLVLIGLYILLSLVVISWIFSLVKAIKRKTDDTASEEALADYITWQRQKAIEMGMDMDAVTFDENGHMRDKITGEQIHF